MQYTDTQATLLAYVRRWNNRLRLTRTVVWLPRGLLIGVLVGLMIATISRLRPWLLPEQILQNALVAVGIMGVLTLVTIWLWPRPARTAAQEFDRRFNLKERISTALEITSGLITAPPMFAERQLEDARVAANRVEANHHLPVKVNWLEVALLVLALVGLAAAILIKNPFEGEVIAQRELQQTIDQQIEQLEQTREQIENDSTLTAEQQEELTQPIDEAIEALQNPDISQAEAVASLAEAEQELREMSQDGQSRTERAANSAAGKQLRANPNSEQAGEALEESDLNQAADELEQLANELDNLSEQERQDLADQLEAAADALQETNPELADQLREAAEALREGDTQRAAEALQDAANTMNQQAQANQQQSQAANQAADQVNQSRQDMSGTQDQQAGNQQQGNQQQGDQGQQSGDQQQSGNQEGDQGQQSGGEQQSGSQGDQQGSEGQQAGDQSDGQQSGNQQGDQQSGEQGSQPGGQQGDQAGDQAGNQAGDQSGEGPASESQGGEQQGQPSGGESADQAGGSGAGDQGSPAGSDTATGEAGQQPGEVSNAPGDDDMREYDPIYVPQRIGEDGTADPEVSLGGEVSNDDGETINQTDFNETFSGESQVPYNRVFQQYQREAQRALDSDYIPIGVRDIIRAYFSSLEP
ncbi:MAG: hypothetical protein H6673_14785 [Anaerolineales bacterium]|nr:hypothetical protein [Anaerolineales bacterium]